MDYKKQVLTMLTEIEKTIKTVNIELEGCPSGSLMITKRDQKSIPYLVKREDGKRKRRSLYRNSELVRNLARKKYLEIQLELLTENSTALQKTLRECHNVDPACVLEKLPESLKGLPEDYFFNSPEDTDWETNYKQSDYRSQDRKKITSRGLHVRSMAEVVICEKLYQYDVPFRYEEEIEIQGYKFAPDFKARRRRDGKIVYWEHCGLPQDPQYMKKHKWKLEQYESVGIVPWENLIVTYGDELGNLDIRIIESEIRNKLL